VVLLIGPRDLLAVHARADDAALPLDPWGVAALLIASLAWSIGSLYSRGADLPRSPVMATGAEMLCGGVLLLLLSTLRGEFMDFEPRQITTSALMSLGYLVVFGSLLAFTAYVWLLRVSTPARVSTYAYVNPMVALFLGWLLNGEPLHGQTLIAASVIIVSVAMLTMGHARRPDCNEQCS
jgi:drug/metabolite transporter (DMT)-like permease